MAGVSLCIAGAVVVYFEYVTHWFYFIGGLMFVVGSVLDILDGARPAQRQGDAVRRLPGLDRRPVGEGFMLGAVGLVMMRDGYEWAMQRPSRPSEARSSSVTRVCAEALGSRLSQTGAGPRTSCSRSGWASPCSTSSSCRSPSRIRRDGVDHVTQRALPGSSSGPLIC